MGCGCGLSIPFNLRAWARAQNVREFAPSRADSIAQDRPLLVGSSDSGRGLYWSLTVQILPHAKVLVYIFSNFQVFFLVMFAC